MQLFFKNDFVYLFVSSLLRSGSERGLLCVASASFSVWGLILLQSVGFSSCASWTLEHGLSSCGAGA